MYDIIALTDSTFGLVVVAVRKRPTSFKLPKKYLCVLLPIILFFHFFLYLFFLLPFGVGELSVGSVFSDLLLEEVVALLFINPFKESAPLMFLSFLEIERGSEIIFCGRYFIYCTVGVIKNAPLLKKCSELWRFFLTV